MQYCSNWRHVRGGEAIGFCGARFAAVRSPSGDAPFWAMKLKLSVLTLSQRLVTPRTPRVSGARLGVQPLQL
eukprot:COSAG06_NODE_7664_length_2423_cov_3.791308_1_plen_71_part_10